MCIAVSVGWRDVVTGGKCTIYSVQCTMYVHCTFNKEDFSVGWRDVVTGGRKIRPACAPLDTLGSGCKFADEDLGGDHDDADGDEDLGEDDGDDNEC